MLARSLLLSVQLFSYGHHRSWQCGSFLPGDRLHKNSYTLTDSVEADMPILADGLRQYRLSLAREARRHSSMASDIAGPGVVIVEVRLGRLSVPPRIGLLSSSGNRELDADALALVASAVQAVSIPDDLRDHSLVLHFPVEYSRGD